jgi:4-amino-4-deoxychorismate lyase
MTLVNGRITSTIAVDDRGLLYGDGLFETIALVNGYPRELDRHLRRLLDGCQRLAITPPDVLVLRREVAQICANVQRAVLKIIITRGQGGRGYRPLLQQEQSTRILMLNDWPDYQRVYWEQGIAATCCRTRLGRNPSLAGIKHLNRLEQVLARGEWKDEYQEGLLLDTENRVVEGTMSNVFMIQDDALHTPELNYAGVAGIMRARILESAGKVGISAHVCELSLGEIEAADALFFCNSLVGIWPVQRLEDHIFEVHPLTRQLMNLFDLL